jgi:hypothetical protein
MTAEEGLALWVATGRLQQLQSLLLYGEGAAAADADDSAAAGGTCSRQLTAGLLMRVADGCQQLRRVSLFGAWSMRTEVCTRVYV